MLESESVSVTTGFSLGIGGLDDLVDILPDAESGSELLSVGEGLALHGGPSHESLGVTIAQGVVSG